MNIQGTTMPKWTDTRNILGTRVSVVTSWDKSAYTHQTVVSWDGYERMVAMRPGSYDAQVQHINWCDHSELLRLIK